MIKIIDDCINDFILFLNENYPMEQIVYLHLCEGFDTIQDPNNEGIAFGMFGNENDEIYVACDIPKEQILKTIAHEYKHFMQKYNNEPYNEEDTENFADDIFNKFNCEIRNYQENCKDCGFCKGGYYDK
jgi:hypothetical protein